MDDDTEIQQRRSLRQRRYPIVPMRCHIISDGVEKGIDDDGPDRDNDDTSMLQISPPFPSTAGKAMGHEARRL